MGIGRPRAGCAKTEKLAGFSSCDRRVGVCGIHGFAGTWADGWAVWGELLVTASDMTCDFAVQRIRMESPRRLKSFKDLLRERVKTRS